jgi:TusE/DsrC/DsvC family sulfur relay protein
MVGMARDPHSGTVPTDAEDYVVNPSDWTEKFAEEVAQSEGITLTNEHWRVIRFMREWLDEHGVAVAPDARPVMKFLAGDRRAGRRRIFELFPYGYVKQACKIAGMKKLRAWSTGRAARYLRSAPRSANCIRRIGVNLGSHVRHARQGHH